MRLRVKNGKPFNALKPHTPAKLVPTPELSVTFVAPTRVGATVAADRSPFGAGTQIFWVSWDKIPSYRMSQVTFDLTLTFELRRRRNLRRNRRFGLCVRGTPPRYRRPSPNRRHRHVINSQAVRSFLSSIGEKPFSFGLNPSGCPSVDGPTDCTLICRHYAACSLWRCITESKCHRTSCLPRLRPMAWRRSCVRCVRLV